MVRRGREDGATVAQITELQMSKLPGAAKKTPWLVSGTPAAEYYGICKRHVEQEGADGEAEVEQQSLAEKKRPETTLPDW